MHLLVKLSPITRQSGKAGARPPFALQVLALPSKQVSGRSKERLIEIPSLLSQVVQCFSVVIVEHANHDAEKLTDARHASSLLHSTGSYPPGLKG